ncbi:MAG: hypothetical protein RBU21_08475 [FCB group bacterium]|jgi:hypothetical protein|nr:hypothetical protein [FCB group bacterium]
MGARIRLHIFAFAVAAIVVYAALAIIFHTWNPFTSFRRELPPSFDGDSAALKSTQIVPTLDTPMKAGKNVVWCATFTAGWKELQEKVPTGPINLTDAAEVCARLNAAPDPAPTMPAEAFYANAGLIEDGIIATVSEDMRVKFGSGEVPDLGRISETNGFMFFSYLQAHVPFTLNYLDNTESLQFTASDGAKTPIHSFGFRREDARHYRIKKQPKVLMVRWQEKPDTPGSNVIRPEWFALDLCRDSAPYQIVAARVPRQQTLAATIETLEHDLAAAGDLSNESGQLDSVMQAPNISWQMKHHYRELEGHAFTNPELEGRVVGVARQDIQFQLDKSGAKVKSRSLTGGETAPAAAAVVDGFIREHVYLFDEPFLLYIKMVNQKMPFFVMWVDNAELLQHWDA